MDAEEKKIIVDIWKTIVEVQQHFNDIEMKIRGIFVTMVLALIAAQGFLAEKDLSLEFGTVKILYVCFAPLLGIVGTFLFYFMDKHWYHRLLVGSVLHAIEIEKRYANDLPDLGLSASIGAASPVKLKNRFLKLVAHITVSDEKYLKNDALHSDGKIELFYKSVAYLFLTIFVFTILFTGVAINGSSLFLVLWRLI